MNQCLKLNIYALSEIYSNYFAQASIPHWHEIDIIYRMPPTVSSYLALINKCKNLNTTVSNSVYMIFMYGSRGPHNRGFNKVKSNAVALFSCALNRSNTRKLLLFINRMHSNVNKPNFDANYASLKLLKSLDVAFICLTEFGISWRK